MPNNKKCQEIADALISEIKNKTNSCIVYQGIITEKSKNLNLSEDIPEVFRYLTAPENYKKPYHLLDYISMNNRLKLVDKDYNISNKAPRDYYYIILHIPYDIRNEYEILASIEKNIVDSILDNNGIYIDLMKSTDHTIVGIKNYHN